MNKMTKKTQNPLIAELRKDSHRYARLAEKYEKLAEKTREAYKEEVRFAAELEKDKEIIHLTDKRRELNFAVFGSASYDTNLRMIEQYGQRHNLNFRAPTTAESLFAATYLAPPRRTASGFTGLAEDNPLQLGIVLAGKDGMYVNPPTDKKGRPTTDERILKQLTERAKNVNGIWILQNGLEEDVRDFGFAPVKADGNCTIWGDGGWADVGFYWDYDKESFPRLLEHTKGEAEDLKKIIERNLNSLGYIDVCPFPARVPNERRVISLSGSIGELHLYSLDRSAPFCKGNLIGVLEDREK